AFRQIANKADSIGEEHSAIRQKANRADRRVERREHLRRNQDLSTAKRIEQSGLAGIGVPHQRNGSQRNRIASFAAQRPLLAHFVDAGLDLAHALANPAAVGFQFFLPRAANADSSCPASRPTSATTPALAA